MRRHLFKHESWTQSRIACALEEQLKALTCTSFHTLSSLKRSVPRDAE